MEQTGTTAVSIVAGSEVAVFGRSFSNDRDTVRVEELAVYGTAITCIALMRNRFPAHHDAPWEERGRRNRHRC